MADKPSLLHRKEFCAGVLDTGALLAKLRELDHDCTVDAVLRADTPADTCEAEGTVDDLAELVRLLVDGGPLYRVCFGGGPWGFTSFSVLVVGDGYNHQSEDAALSVAEEWYENIHSTCDARLEDSDGHETSIVLVDLPMVG